MKFPAGKYYIGDLCYVMSDDEWQEVCSLLEDDNDGHLTLKNGKQFACFRTAYGDGTYRTNADGSCSVDSGTIGCLLMCQCSQQPDPELGLVVDIATDFAPYNVDGDMTFGHVDVYTNDEDEYEGDNDMVRDWEDKDHADLDDHDYDEDDFCEDDSDEFEDEEDVGPY
jgi:hypothetical protein